MDGIILSVKILIYSILGYYIFNIILHRKGIFLGIIEPFYGFFGILCCLLCRFRLIFVYFLGILIGFFVNFVLGLINKRLEIKINYKWLGLLAVLNVFVLDDLIDYFVLSSKYSSICFLFVVGISIAVLDVAITLRKIF